jgi:hypothetical protein
MCNLSRDSESKYVVPEYCDTEIRGGAVLPQKKYSYEKRTLEYLRKNKQSMVSQIKKESDKSWSRKCDVALST